MLGSNDLHALYLDPAEAGVAWLLDPGSPTVAAALQAATSRASGDPCDAEAIIADLPDLLVLLRERHFGLATGRVPYDGLGAWAEAWRARLVTDQAATWGAALGTAFHQLRQLVGDRHLHATGESPQLLHEVDPRWRERCSARAPASRFPSP